MILETVNMGVMFSGLPGGVLFRVLFFYLKTEKEPGGLKPQVPEADRLKKGID